MSSGKALIFIVLSSTIMMSAVLLQNVFNPPKVKNPAQQVEGQAGDNQAKANADDVDAESPDDKGNPDASANQDTADNDVKNDNAGDAKSDDDAIAKVSKSDATTEPDAENDPQEKTSPESALQDDLVSIGSLALDGSDRFLITLNKRGGTIHRVELNFRDEKGRYKYRDLVWEGGYLGSLDCIDSDEGCQVQVVGRETPADRAGIQVGDIIVSLDGEPVASAIDFLSILNDPKKSKPGQTMHVVVKRDKANQQLSVLLTEKPISIIRPESGIVDPDFDYPESFVLSLVNPLKELGTVWPDLDSGMRDGLWKVASITPSEIEFEYQLSESQLKPLGLSGPLTAFKRFKIPSLVAEDIHELDSRTFHLELEIEIKNGSDQAQSLAYELDGPTGVTAETWWYANKIHGRQTAIGYIAGARDIVGKTGINSYVFYGCPELVKAVKKKTGKVRFICDPFQDDPRNRELFFVGVDSHYFNVALIPQMSDGAPYIVNSITAYPNNREGILPEIPKNARLQKLVDMTFQMVAPVEIAPGESFKQTFDVFCGPKDIEVLDDYELGNVRTFGWFGWCSMVLLYIMNFFYTITFGVSYGLAIILLTVSVRCLMIPMSRKAALNAQMMQHLAPQTKEIAEKYKDDLEKKTAAQRELYKKYNFNPLSGCLMMFVQLPIFYGLYKGLNVDIALRGQALIPGMSWCSNLAAPDQLMYWKSWMPSVLADETGWLGPYFNILPLITMVLFIAQQKLFTPPPTDDQQKMMQKVMTFMMLFMGIMFFKVPAGLCIYFITSSLWGIIERKMLPKPVLDTDKLESSSDGKPSRRETRAGAKLAKEKKRASNQKASDAEDRKRRNVDRKKRLKKRDR